MFLVGIIELQCSKTEREFRSDNTANIEKNGKLRHNIFNPAQIPYRLTYV